MNLTNYHRDSFIRAAMNDVPTTDYTQQIRNLILEYIVSNLPVDVRKVWDNPAIRPFLKEDYNTYFGVTVYHPSMHSSALVIPVDVSKKALELKALKDNQETVSKNLRESLRAAAYSCRTRKQLQALLPQFEAYLPNEIEPVKKDLPVVTNIVDDFTKAGWPKKQAKVSMAVPV